MTTRKKSARGSPFGSDFTVIGDPSPPSASLVESRERPHTAGGTFEIRIMTNAGILCVMIICFEGTGSPRSRGDARFIELRPTNNTNKSFAFKIW